MLPHNATYVNGQFGHSHPLLLDSFRLTNAWVYIKLLFQLSTRRGSQGQLSGVVVVCAFIHSFVRLFVRSLVSAYVHTYVRSRCADLESSAPRIIHAFASANLRFICYCTPVATACDWYGLTIFILLFSVFIFFHFAIHIQLIIIRFITTLLFSLVCPIALSQSSLSCLLACLCFYFCHQ